MAIDDEIAVRRAFFAAILILLRETDYQGIMDQNNISAVSVASLWENEIKHRKRPETMPYSSALLEMAIDAAGYDLLPIKGAHIDCLEAFISQEIHNDPFDHLLLATAKVEQMTLLTHDSNIALYKNALIQVC